MQLFHAPKEIPWNLIIQMLTTGAPCNYGTECSSGMCSFNKSEATTAFAGTCEYFDTHTCIGSAQDFCSNSYLAICMIGSPDNRQNDCDLHRLFDKGSVICNTRLNMCQITD
jgi:hypothetical protein